ncbi:MAG: ATP-binding cassette domain-containing protein, partial [Oscillospiraceae bacterium]
LDACGIPETLSLRDMRRILAAGYRTFDAAKFEALAARFSLPERKAVKDYSCGMRMKLSLACALSHDCRLLILDEATSGLDPVVRDELLDIFLEFIQDEGHSIFVSSHILSDLEKVCDYITFIHGGKIVFSEEKDALLEKYVVAKLSEAELRSLEPGKVAGVRRSSFGAEALVERSAARGLVCDPASIGTSCSISEGSQNEGAHTQGFVLPAGAVNPSLLCSRSGWSSASRRERAVFNALSVIYVILLPMMSMSFDERAHWDSGP